MNEVKEVLDHTTMGQVLRGVFHTDPIFGGTFLRKIEELRKRRGSLSKKEGETQNRRPLNKGSSFRLMSKFYRGGQKWGGASLL